MVMNYRDLVLSQKWDKQCSSGKISNVGFEDTGLGVIPIVRQKPSWLIASFYESDLAKVLLIFWQIWEAPLEEAD